MITLIKMKYKEWKLKLAFLTMVENVVREKESIIKLAGNLYTTLKDVPMEELQKEFVSVIAKLVHEDNKSE
ncbi:hypothetical protein [Anaerosporobacter sp.]|uniref:hypothetical protein n=1 Tax=Anaerosporobacter sp. TaxID=1872529 RepID=UPI00286FA7B3|nr:hypothetical protein [Anaerosporobacter sp.]